MNIRITYYSLFLIAFGFASCTTNPIVEGSLQQSDGRYDSEFPQQSVSDELSFLSSTVRKLDCLVFYRTYIFPVGNKIERKELAALDLDDLSIGNDVTNESVTGTATVIYYDGNQVALLTCAHVVDFPDTLFNYYSTGGLRSVSVKLKQQNFVTGLPEGEEVEVIARDQKKDIALLNKVLHGHTQPPAVLNYPIGKTRDLEWGTVVYTLGFPIGNLMVTRSIVSNPGRTASGMFLTDALFNHGISGSPVLALRDGVPNFEWVGMASSSSAESIHFLKPTDDVPQLLSPDSQYEGEFLIGYRKSINYGVTYSVRIEDIVKFLSANEKIIEEKGIDNSLFFK